MKVKLWMAVFLLCLGIGCASKRAMTPESPADTPSLNYEAGMQYLEKQQYDEAISSFSRAQSLDKNYLPAYVGLGLAYLGKGDYKTAAKHIQQAKEKNIDYSPAYTAMGRIYEAQGKHKDALKEFEIAIDKDENNADAYFYQGQTYIQLREFDKAKSSYASALRINPIHPAGTALEELQKREFAQAVSPEYEAIADSDAITRGDLAALFSVELNLERTMRSKIPPEAEWTPPPSLMGKRKKANERENIPDIANDWAKAHIETVVSLDIMDIYPDGNFRPKEPITRTNFAIFIQNILVKALSDDTLSTKFIGQASPFPDVPNSHFAFNAIVVATTRGIMRAKLNGSFGLLESVSGADALLTLRNLKEVLSQ